MFGCSVFINLQKALDTVNHSILLHELQHYGIVGSMEAPSKAFLLFFLLPHWLKLNHLKRRMECGFQTFFCDIFVPP